MNAIKEFATSFSSLTLHAVNLLLWKKTLSITLFKTITISRSSILLRVFLMGIPGCPAKGGNCGVSPWKPKNLNFPLWSPPPKNWVLNHRPHIGKKGISNSFRQILLKILPPACIFSHTIMTYLQRLVGTKFLNTKQCPAGLSPRIIPHFLLKPSWETLRMGENPTLQPKIYSFPLTKKSPLINLHLKLSKVSSFLPH